MVPHHSHWHDCCYSEGNSATQNGPTLEVQPLHLILSVVDKSITLANVMVLLLGDTDHSHKPANQKNSDLTNLEFFSFVRQ